MHSSIGKIQTKTVQSKFPLIIIGLPKNTSIKSQTQSITIQIQSNISFDNLSFLFFFLSGIRWILTTFFHADRPGHHIQNQNDMPQNDSNQNNSIFSFKRTIPNFIFPFKRTISTKTIPYFHSKEQFQPNQFYISIRTSISERDRDRGKKKARAYLNWPRRERIQLANPPQLLSLLLLNWPIKTRATDKDF